MSKAKPLVFSAVSIALGLVLSMIKIIHMPLGGSITLCSMLFVCLPGYFYGPIYGFSAAFAYGLLQFLFNGYVVSIPQVICDYFLAFGALGLGCIFRKKRFGLILDYLTGLFGRFFFSFISGVIFYGMYASDYNLSAVVYSLLYNGAYILGEGIITILLLMIPALRNNIERIRESSVFTDEKANKISKE